MERSRALQAAQKSTQSDVFDLLFSVDTWEAFAHHVRNQRSDSNPVTPVPSLEAIHDKIHLAIGGSGFMGDLGVAGTLLLFSDQRIGASVSHIRAAPLRF